MKGNARAVEKKNEATTLKQQHKKSELSQMGKLAFIG